MEKNASAERVAIINGKKRMIQRVHTRPHAEHYTVEIDVENVSPAAKFRLVQRRVVHDACSVDEDVDDARTGVHGEGEVDG